MTFPNKVRERLEHKGYIFTERQIQHGVQFNLLDGIHLNIFNTGRVSIQGKGTKKTILEQLQSITNI